MNLNQLAQALNKMYFGAKDKETAAMIHLFGIKYAEEIKACGESSKSIAKAAGIPESYGTEIRKGVNLAKHVRVL
tara:strand:- start:850 stop:1074 length:225 start_codon:yes stop_codon:yes gene_type:complete